MAADGAAMPAAMPAATAVPAQDAHGGKLCPCGSRMRALRCTRCPRHDQKSGLCAEHGKRRNNCMLCLRESGRLWLRARPSDPAAPAGGSVEICRHRLARKHCRQCGGSHLCTFCRLTVTRRKNSECAGCRRWRNHDLPRKPREKAVLDFVRAEIAAGRFPPFNSADKRADRELDPALYGSWRLDVLWKLASHWVVLEVDEDQHKGYDAACERRRELDIFNSARGLPVRVLRYNPDVFATGSRSARRPLAVDRLGVLRAALAAALAPPQPTDALLSITRLFYDCACMDDACAFTHTDAFEDHLTFFRRHSAAPARGAGAESL